MRFSRDKTQVCISTLFTFVDLVAIGPLQQRRVGAFNTNGKDLLYITVSCVGNLIEIEEEIDIVDVCRKMERRTSDF